MEARCQCGAVSFTVPGEPVGFYVCHCTECRAQSSSAFGITVSFPNFELPRSTTDRLGVYVRPTDSGKTLRCLFCKTCGSRMLHLTDGGRTISVKGGALKDLGKGRLELANAVHIWCKRALVPIPEGAEQYDEEPPE